MSVRLSVARFFAAVLFLAVSSAPAVAQGVGAIAGTATDESGAVLPGATVTLSSPGIIGGAQTSITDERGTYQFTRLVPGRYSVKGELQGFRPFTQENVPVNADQTSRIDLMLAIGALEEGVVVSGQAPLLDTTTVMKQTVLTRELLDSLPNRNDIWSMVRVVPGVVVSKVDVGGSEAFLSSTTSVHGTSNENGFLIDGMDVSWVNDNGNGPMLYFDPYIYEEANVQTAGGPAERSKGGVNFNQVTKTGTNQFHGGATYAVSGRGLSSSNYSDALKTQLLATVPGAALAANPNITPNADIARMYDVGGWLGGPIVPNRLWFVVSAHDAVLDQYKLGSYDTDGSQVIDDNLLRTVGTKLSYQVSPRNQISWFYTVQKKVIGHRGGGTFADSAARNYSNKVPQINQVKWTSPISSKMVLDVSGSSMRVNDRFDPRPEVPDGAIARFDAVTQYSTVALPTYSSTPEYRYAANTSINYYTGRHDLKVGYQYMRSMFGSDVTSTSGMRAIYRNGLPDSVNTYTTPTSLREFSVEQALYFQDRWTPSRKLTLNMGLRWEAIRGWAPEACQTATLFNPDPRCFPALEDLPNFKNLMPRVSAIYDLTGDGRTALKFSANRYAIPIGVSYVHRVNPFAVANDTRVWTVCASGQTTGCDANHDLTPQLGELGPSTGYSLGNKNRYADGIERPVSNEFSAEIQRQFGDVVASVGYTYRTKRRDLGFRNVAVPTETYIPLAVTERNSGESVTVFNQDPALRGRIDNLYDNSSELNSDYQGTDVTVNKRMSHRWSLMGGASFGKTTGYLLGDLNNPNSQEFARGIIGNDLPWSYRLSGVWEAPFETFVSATASYYKGFPEETTVSVGNNTVLLTQGSQSVMVDPRGTIRFPNVSQVDMSVRKGVRLAGSRLSARLDVYNLLNRSAITSRITTLGPTYHRASAIQRGRLVKLGLSVDF
ncbi:MAG: TonB-dependent receptor [Acidobacteria bacterium]|nr:TonB-dependent receptor [Acidobacteriota bacterium]